MAPVPLYSVERLLFSSETQNGTPGPTARPHGFDKLGSIVVVVATTPALFETNAVSANPLVAGGGGGLLLLLLPPPPPQATRLRAPMTPNETVVDARFGMARRRFIVDLHGAGICVLSGDLPCTGFKIPGASPFPPKFPAQGSTRSPPEEPGEAVIEAQPFARRDPLSVSPNRILPARFTTAHVSLEPRRQCARRSK